MVIGGLQRFTLIDYPGKVAAIVFTQGCNLRCPYCYNRSLVLPEFFGAPLPQAEIFAFLESRKGRLDGVVVTGGEPTVHPDLPQFLRAIREMGFLVKLDTNGACPEILEEVIREGLVDYIAMDVKAPLPKYPEVTGSGIAPEKIQRSIALILESGLEHEFRTTVVKEMLTPEDIVETARLIRGASRYALQRFMATETLVNPDFRGSTSYSDEELREIAHRVAGYAGEVILR